MDTKLQASQTLCTVTLKLPACTGGELLAEHSATVTMGTNMSSTREWSCGMLVGTEIIFDTEFILTAIIFI